MCKGSPARGGDERGESCVEAPSDMLVSEAAVDDSVMDRLLDIVVIVALSDALPSSATFNMSGCL